MKNNVVIITGGTSGIGRSLVFKYASKGSKIVFNGRNQVQIDEISSILSKDGIDHLALKLDVAIEADNQVLIEKTIQKYGRIDALICNAGISMRALFEDIELSVFKQVMDVNFYGTLYACKYALPHIISSKGSIIGISSINGHRGTPARTAYSASKFAMEGFLESLRTEVMKKGVHVLSVSPGFTGTNIRNTALTADGTRQAESPRDESKMMTSEEVANSVYRAHKRKKRDLVLTSLGKAVVFLNKWIPGVMDGLVYNAMAKEPDSPFK